MTRQSVCSWQTAQNRLITSPRSFADAKFAPCLLTGRFVMTVSEVEQKHIKILDLLV